MIKPKTNTKSFKNKRKWTEFKVVKRKIRMLDLLSSTGVPKALSLEELNLLSQSFKVNQVNQLT